MNKLKKLTFGIFSVLLLSACGTIKPEAPDIIVEENYVITEPDISSIKVPLKINLTPYFKATDESLDYTFEGEEQNCSGVSFKYRFARKPIEFKGVGDKLLFDVDGKYSLWLNYCPSCTDLFSSEPYCVTARIYASCGVNEPMRKIHVGYETKIGVTKNYSLRSNTKLRAVEAKSPCKITVFEYDATETLKEEVSNVLRDLEKDIDKEINSVSLKAEIEETWKLLHEPTDLAGYGFLELNPQSISVSEIKYIGNQAEIDVILKANPKVLSQPSGTPIKPLPYLSDFEDRDGFDITTDIYSNYDSLSSVLTRDLKGLKLDLKGKEVIFGDISIHGAQNKMVSIQLDFTGSKKGTIYLIGTPVFDAEAQHISFPDLEFDVKTKSALLKSAKWLFDKKVTTLIRESAAMDLEPYLEELKKTMNESLNIDLDDGIRMSGNVEQVKINSIQPLENQLHIRLNSLGKLGIEMM